MPWCKVEKGDLLYGDTVVGPGFTRGADGLGGAVAGWSWHATLRAGYTALGVAQKVQGPDRAALDSAIAAVTGTALKAQLIVLRDSDPEATETAEVIRR